MIAAGVLGSACLLLRWLFSHPPEESHKRENLSRGHIYDVISSKYGSITHEWPTFEAPFAVSHIVDKDERFLLFLPYEGATNQFYCLIRALYLARQLKRILLIPPLTPSRHDRLRGAYLDWRHVIDFSSVDTNPSISCRYRFIDIEIVPKLREMLDADGSGCITYGRWRHFYVLGLTVANFATAFNLTDHLRLDYHDLLSQSDRNSTYLLNVFTERKDARLVCAANLQHLSFGSFMNEYLHSIKFSAKIAAAAWAFLQHVGVRDGRYGAVHWRRGDFSLACKNKVLEQCWPSIEQLRRVILRVAEEHGLDVFLVGTNDEDFALDMSENGIDVLRIGMQPLTADDPPAWTELAPVFVDTFLFSYADYFVGNRYSTVSRSVYSRRQHAGLGFKTEYF